MTDTIDELQRLFKHMESALVTNNVTAVQELTSRQQMLISQLAQEAKRNPGLKEKVREVYPVLQSQLNTNQQLLKQALQLTEGLIKSVTAARTQVTYKA